MSIVTSARTLFVAESEQWLGNTDCVVAVIYTQAFADLIPEDHALNIISIYIYSFL